MTANPPTVSVAILNHCRPHLLARVLCGVSRLSYPNFEIVAVSDQADLAAAGVPKAIAAQVRHVHFTEANICRARNLAVAAAGGDVIAFLDDDAVPEPDWLTQLLRGFQVGNVAAVGGFVRGCDGISVEWQGGLFDRAGVEQALELTDDFRAYDAASQAAGGQFVGVRGTNMAFLREAVCAVGGFDEAFRYYLDETDLLLRLAEAGWDSALVRTAEVHHLRDANATRDRLRTPRNLFEIAASKAYFCKRHLPEGEIDTALAAFRMRRQAELDPHIRLGLVRREERDALLAQVDDGIAEGRAREPSFGLSAAPRWQGFRPSERPEAAGALSLALISGWGIGSIRRTRALARRLAALGHEVTCLSFFSGVQPRSVRYADGVWLHAGGTWRPDHKVGARRVIGRRARAAAELARVARHRRFDLVLHPPGTLELGEHDGAEQCDAAALGLPLVARLCTGARRPLGAMLADLAAVAHAHAATSPQNRPNLTGNSALPAG